MNLEISVVGTDYATAPIELRSRFSFTETGKIEFSELLLERGCREAVILSTCNRSEVYVYAEEGFGEAVKSLLLERFGAAGADCLYTRTGRDAVRHLFRVAAGMESAVVGEDQILGQVREAHAFAAAAGMAGKVLNKVFREAVTTAKQIKSELGISTLPLSVCYIGIRKLSQTLGGLAGKRFLVIGTGEMGGLAVKYLQDEGAAAVLWCSRSCGRACAAETGETVTMIPFADRYGCIPEIDGIITATASPHTVLQRDRMPAREKPLCIIDMAVPPDAEPEIGTLPGVTLFNIDALNTVSEENYAQRLALSEKADGIIGEKTGEFEAWLFRSRVDTAAGSLNERCALIAQDTETYLFNKLSLSEREKKLVTKMIESSLHRLIREPILRLKELDSQGKQTEYLNMIRELFDLDEND